MSLRGLVIGIAVVVAIAIVAVLAQRSVDSPSDGIRVGGTVIGGDTALGDTAADPTEEYIRQLGTPDTAGLELLHEDPESADPVPLPGPPVGAAAPHFNLRTVTGSSFRLSDVAGRVVVLNFWATWCEPCRDEIPGLITMQERLEDEGLRVVGVSVDENGREIVSDFTQAFPFNYPLLIDGRLVAEEYGAHVAVPTTVVVDRKGRIAARVYGAVERDSLEKHVQPLL